MLNLNLENSGIDLSAAKAQLEKFKSLPLPDFTRLSTDANAIKKFAKKYSAFKNILIAGNGGAINSFKAFYSALAKYRTDKNVEILNTIEPDHLNDIKSNYSVKDTLLVVISKSGTNPTPLEILFVLKDYQKVFVCTEGSNALCELAKREKIDYLTYPSVSHYPSLDDRHTGLTASGLFPAALVGIDIADLYSGAEEMYKKCSSTIALSKNPALQLATAFYLLEKKGFVEIFCPVYSTKIASFLPLLTQFMHETVCKNETGQSFFGGVAPESQHHTNQRLFGGRKNIIAFFITTGQQDVKTQINIPGGLKNIPLRESTLGVFDKIPCSALLDFEFKGTVHDAVEKKIPAIHLNLAEVSPRSVGQLVALFQYVAVYSAYLRNVNPFGQPQVERSKEITFELVKKYGKLF